MKKLYIILALILLLTFSCKKDKYNKQDLIEITSFGENKGNLKMYYHKPINANDNMPLVVVIHGCAQNSLQISEATEWNRLADKYGFFVLYPEQKSINNTTNCFQWFLDQDNERDKGEVSSIMEMTTFLQNKYKINTEKTFVTGMSAGGAMTIAMISTYPSLYSSAASIAGVPYKTKKQILTEKTAEELADYVRNQNPNYSGEYSKLMILQGKKDIVVNPKNAKKLEEQWLNVFFENNVNTYIEMIDFSPDIHITYFYKGSELIMQKVIFDNLAHAIPIDMGTGEKQGGKEGLFTKDSNYFSTYWIAYFFGLID